MVSTKLRLAGLTSEENENNLHQTRKELEELESILKEVHMWGKKNDVCEFRNEAYCAKVITLFL